MEEGSDHVLALLDVRRKKLVHLEHVHALALEDGRERVVAEDPALVCRVLQVLFPDVLPQALDHLRARHLQTPPAQTKNQGAGSPRSDPGTAFAEDAKDRTSAWPRNAARAGERTITAVMPAPARFGPALLGDPSPAALRLNGLDSTVLERLDAFAAARRVGRCPASSSSSCSRRARSSSVSSCSIDQPHTVSMRGNAHARWRKASCVNTP